MSSRLPRIALALATALLLSCASAAATSIPSHGYFVSNGLYDCQVFQPVTGIGGYWSYVNSYKFSSNGTYSESGARNGRQLAAPVNKGRYHLKGNKIIPSSGVLKKAHDYMVIQKSSLHVAQDNGHLSGLNCIRIYPKPPPAPKVVALATYTCVDTALGTDPLQPTYYTSQVVTKTLTFFSDRTYQPNDLSSKGNWHASGNKIVFTSGPYWTSGFSPEHAVGLLETPGVPMPHAAAPFDPSTLYSLVIRDTVAEGGIPPYQEFTNYDGPPSAPYTGDPQSWFYCNKS
jgi:hypothetical protein